MTTSEDQSPANSNIRNPTFNISGHEKSVICIAWLPDDRLVTGSYDKTVRIWELTNDKQEGTPIIHQYLPLGIVTTKDGRIVSCSHQGKRLMLWSSNMREVVTAPWSNEDYGPAFCVALSPNEELLVSCHKTQIVFWEMVGTIPRVKNHIKYKSIELGVAMSACFSPDGKRLATNCANRGPIISDVESGEWIMGPFFYSPGLGAIIWSPSGDRLFCGYEREIRCLDSSIGKSVGEPWIGHTQGVNCFSISPDGKWLASGSSDGTVRFWDMKSSDLVGEPLYSEGEVSAVAFSPSGEFVACNGSKGCISVWRVPWWNDDQQALRFLELSAVVPPDRPSNNPRELESDLNLPDSSRAPQRRPLAPRPGRNPSNDPPLPQSSLSSRRWWKRIPRLTFHRSHPIYTGSAQPRTYVASSDGVHSPPTSPGFTRTIVVESDSGENSDESTASNATSDIEVGGIGCCGLLSRKRPRTIQIEAGDASVPRPSPPNSNNPNTPAPVAQDILEASAVVRRSSDIP